MLSIERRCGEAFFIGDDIQVEVLALGYTFVKLAIRAPRRLAILRGEVLDRGSSAGEQERDQTMAMLIVRRRCGESLRIGANAEIIISRLRPSRVTFVAHAAPDVRIRRSESRVANEERVAEIFSQARSRPPDEGIVQTN
ncbi:MAG TPA: carbon storage regulator [Bryobacteraceae bacterium]|nr:carbon storage regulator [Bryobacteraceae bacterium]